MKRFLTSIPLIISVLFVCGVLAAILFYLSPAEIVKALRSKETLFALRLSLLTSLAAVAVSLLLGVPSAYILARRSIPFKPLIDTLLDLPLVMTPLVAGIGLLFLFGQDWLGGSLFRLGIHVVFTPLGAVVAQTFICLPIVIRSSKVSFEGVNDRYEMAGLTLGLERWQIFMYITLPLAWQGILTGAMLAWARALGEFGATLMVAGATRFKTATLPVSVYLNISSGELGLALACAWLLLMTGFVLLLIIKMLGGSRKNALTVAGGV